MLITDSYLGNRFNGQQIAADAYDNFLKKKGGAASRPAGSPPTKRQQKKANKAQKKELKKQGLAPKKGPFGKRKAATGMNSPAAKKTGLFGIKQKINPILAKLKKPADPIPAPAPMDAADDNKELNEAETPLPDSQAEALADGASTDLGEISDKTPSAQPEVTPEAEGGGQGEPQPEPGSEEEQFYSYDLEKWSGRRRRRPSYDSFDEPKEGEKKPAEKKKTGISVGAVLGLLGAVAAGAIAMYVVMSAGEKTGQPELNLTRTY